MENECSQCKVYEVPELMIESGDSVANYTLQLSDDPCAIDGIDTSECCHFDAEMDQCVTAFIGSNITYPCKLCDAENTTTTDDTKDQPEEVTCACLDFYPNATMFTPRWEYGNSTQLTEITDHKCRHPYGVNFTECCEFDHESLQCGIVREGSFTSPCGSCTMKTKAGTRTLSKEVILALVGGSILVLLVIACWFWRYRARPQDVEQLAKKANEKMKEERSRQKPDENWDALPIGGLDNNSGDALTAVAAPVVFAEVIGDGDEVNHVAPIPLPMPVAV